MEEGIKEHKRAHEVVVPAAAFKAVAVVVVGDIEMVVEFRVMMSCVNEA